MSLKEEILYYIEKNRDNVNHTFKDGTQVKNQKLSRFLINWYNQAIDEWEKYQTTKNADAIKKLIK